MNKLLKGICIPLLGVSMLTGCAEKDTEAPEIKVDTDALTIEQNCGTELNLKNYFKDKVKVTDNVDDNVSYKIYADKDYYDKKSGKVDTEYSTEFKGKITAKDKAGNKTSKDFSVKLNPIVVSVDNKTPLVYDGQYAKITVQSFRHGNIDGMDEYQLIFEVENRTDDYIIVYLPYDTSINNYQVGAYYTIKEIAPGLTGTMESQVREEDIPDSIGYFTQIDTDVCISHEGDDKAFYSVSMILNTDAADPYSNQIGDKMKRLITLILCLLFGFSLVGCKNNDDSDYSSSYEDQNDDYDDAEENDSEDYDEDEDEDEDYSDEDFDGVDCSDIDDFDEKMACYDYQKEQDDKDLDELRDNLYKVQDEINSVNQAKRDSNNQIGKPIFFYNR